MLSCHVLCGTRIPVHVVPLFRCSRWGLCNCELELLPMLGPDVVPLWSVCEDLHVGVYRSANGVHGAIKERALHSVSCGMQSRRCCVGPHATHAVTYTEKPNMAHMAGNGCTRFELPCLCACTPCPLASSYCTRRCLHVAYVI